MVYLRSQWVIHHTFGFVALVAQTFLMRPSKADFRG